jgi:myo-inositol-1(or 4)-monophosphatase
MNTIPTNVELLATAVAAARHGGAYALDNRRRRAEVQVAARHDVKLQLDVETQALITTFLHERYPAHDVLGEEDSTGGTGAAATRPEWIVDPIDGTVNFFHGLPYWCCSVAVRVGERVLAGAVFAPELNLLYAASADSPATCNEKPIAVSGTPRLEEAMIQLGLSQKAEAEYAQSAHFARIACRAQKVRIMGAAAIDMCFVAEGRTDGYWEPSIYLWDMAAAGLIVERAGGRTELLGSNGHQVNFMATNGHIHDALKALVATG